MLDDFKNSFTVVLSSKFATKPVTYFPPNLKCVTTLPHEIQKINDRNSLDVFDSFLFCFLFGVTHAPFACQC